MDKKSLGKGTALLSLKATAATTASSDESNHFILVACDGDGQNQKLLTVSDNGKVCSVSWGDEYISSQLATTTLWRQEFVSGELCYISNPHADERLQCNLYGKLTMDSNWGGWEVWRLIQIPNTGIVLITSWTHDQKVLCSDPDGNVYSTENKLGEWEKWTIEKQSDKGVLIRSVTHKRFLTIAPGKGNGLCTSLEATNSDYCYWSFEPAHRNVFYLSSKAHDKRLGCNPEHCLYTTDNRKHWEEWKIVIANDGLVSIQSDAHGSVRYLTPSKNGINEGFELVETEQLWDLQDSPLGGVCFLSKDDGRYLICNSDGTASLKHFSESSDEERTWLLEPRMPNSLSGDQLMKMTVAGIAGLGAIIAAPFAVMGVVGALGFTSGGIAAGSIGAGMMSAEAIAAGGGVVAGGTVATLQSIGAAGLGFAGASAAMGGGAVVGSTIVGSTAACVLKSDHQSNLSSNDDGNDSDVGDWSFAGWRNWPTGARKPHGIE